MVGQLSVVSSEQLRNACGVLRAVGASVRLRRGALAALGCLGVVVAARTLWKSRFAAERRRERQQHRLGNVAADALGNNRVELSDAMLKRFVAALQIPTISVEIDEPPVAELERLQQLMRSEFKHVFGGRHDFVHVQTVAQYSLLVTIDGSAAELKPCLLCAHMDVVPVADQRWSVDPFGAVIRDGFIWARGTIDDKGSLFAILEAVESLLAKGWRPRRGIILAFGHDEEVGGKGAQAMAAVLEERGVQVDFVLDEGLVLINNFPQIKPTVALIGVAEKAFVSIELTVLNEGGHSSLPARRSAIGTLAAAVSRLERKQFPSRFGRGPEGAMWDYLVPHLRFPLNVLMSNQWLFSPVIRWLMSLTAATDSMQRTSTALTMFHGGHKDNVIAQSARAVVNHRLHPADDMDAAVARDRRVIDDEHVGVRPYRCRRAVPMSSWDCAQFDVVAAAVETVFGAQVCVVPSLFIAASDSGAYARLTSNIYRFCPTHFALDDLKRFHGADERLAVANYEQYINFYLAVLLIADRR